MAGIDSASSEIISIGIPQGASKLRTDLDNGSKGNGEGHPLEIRDPGKASRQCFIIDSSASTRRYGRSRGTLSETVDIDQAGGVKRLTLTHMPRPRLRITATTAFIFSRPPSRFTLC